MFAELSAAFAGRDAPTPPTLGEVASIIRRHGELLAEHFGEDKGMRDIRKHVAWYMHGFPAGADLRRALALVKTPARARRPAVATRPGRAVPACGRGSARTSGLARIGVTSGGLAQRSGRLHGARGRRRDELRRLIRRGTEMC